MELETLVERKVHLRTGQADGCGGLYPEGNDPQERLTRRLRWSRLQTAGRHQRLVRLVASACSPSCAPLAAMARLLPAT